MRTPSSALRAVRLGAVGLALVLAAAGLPAQEADPPALVTGVVSSALPLTDASRGVVRQQAVTVDLRPLGGATGALPPAGRVRLNLFADVDLVAALERVEATRWGASWVGRVQGVPGSLVVFAIVNGRVAGNVTYEGRHFDVASMAGRVIVSEIDDALLMGEDAAEPPASWSDAPARTEGAVSDDPAFQDLMALYTPATRDALGSESAVLARIQAGVATANQIYRNSGVNTTLRLACTGEANYAETGDYNLDLNRLTGQTDGYIDNIHATRDSCGADIVTLLVNKMNTFCGYAWIGGRTSQTPFSIITHGCAGTNLLAHEIGHNQGLHHDWYMTAAGGAFPYAKGFVDLDGSVYDVMAYSNMCRDAGRNCSQIPYFSNPALTYRGRRIGVPEGTNVSCTANNLSNPPCDADAARAVNNTAQSLANQRASRQFSNTLSFPPRNETFDFRNQLDAKYRDGLRRGPVSSFSDVEGSVVWTQEYLMYRVQACSHQTAVDKVRTQIFDQGLPGVCGTVAPGQIVFPPRNESLVFRQALEGIYRDELKRPAVVTYVDQEGDVVWIQEYLRYRLNGCNHAQATSRVMTQIDGGGIPPVCQ